MFEESVFYGPDDDLGDTPPEVKAVQARGTCGISYFPKGFMQIDDCGCCFTEHKPGWYERVPYFEGEDPKTSPLQFICSGEV